MGKVCVVHHVGASLVFNSQIFRTPAVIPLIHPGDERRVLISLAHAGVSRYEILDEDEYYGYDVKTDNANTGSLSNQEDPHPPQNDLSPETLEKDPSPDSVPVVSQTHDKAETDSSTEKTDEPTPKTTFAENETVSVPENDPPGETPVIDVPLRDFLEELQMDDEIERMKGSTP